MRENNLAPWSYEQLCQVNLALVELRAGQFFAAHERFEALFQAARGHERTRFHALAQLAASYHQLTLGRGRAAVRTWHKARTKLLALGLLDQGFASALQALHQRLGIDEHGPRFLTPEAADSVVREAQSFPVPSLEALQTPSA